MNFSPLADVAKELGTSADDVVALAQAANVPLWLSRSSEVQWLSAGYWLNGRWLRYSDEFSPREVGQIPKVAIVEWVDAQSTLVEAVRSCGRRGTGWLGHLVPAQRVAHTDFFIESDDVPRIAAERDRQALAASRLAAWVGSGDESALCFAACTDPSEHFCGEGLAFKPVRELAAQWGVDLAVVVQWALDNGFALWIPVPDGVTWHGGGSYPSDPRAVLASPHDRSELARTGTARSITHLFSNAPPNCRYGTMTARDVTAADVLLATRDIGGLKHPARGEPTDEPNLAHADLLIIAALVQLLLDPPVDKRWISQGKKLNTSLVAQLLNDALLDRRKNLRTPVAAGRSGIATTTLRNRLDEALPLLLPGEHPNVSPDALMFASLMALLPAPTKPILKPGPSTETLAAQVYVVLSAAGLAETMPTERVVNILTRADLAWRSEKQ